ncbi:hypothetical protein ACVNF4_13360 [Streptomyces sp. S6]
MTSPLDRALVEEATKKSGLIWVSARPLWHTWHEGAAYVLGDGPGEQPLNGLTEGGTAEVTVRSKDKGGRLVTWTARVVHVKPGTDEYASATGELKTKRLNAPDGEAMLERWSRECRLLRLEPTGETLPMPEGDLASRPVPTPATTRQPIPAAVPRLLFRKRK